eukprot:m.118642 g.118642  ORF g.118642 m.118642 type:complete len:332 (+) comp13659_c1_seq2:140-1135(+)
MAARERILRKGLVNKRSQNLSALTVTNFKQRMLILTPTTLSYYSGKQMDELKLKGSIPLPSIRAVEKVDGTIWDRKFMFQVIHDEATLYMEANNTIDRVEWLEAIRDACLLEANTASKYSKYHSGVFHKGKWSCCGATSEAGGCKNSFKYYHDKSDEVVVEHAPAPAVRMTTDEDFDDELDPDELSDARLAQVSTKPGVRPRTPTMETIISTVSIDGDDLDDIDLASFEPKRVQGRQLSMELDSMVDAQGFGFPARPSITRQQATAMSSPASAAQEPQQPMYASLNHSQISSPRPYEASSQGPDIYASLNTSQSPQKAATGQEAVYATLQK